MPQPTLQFVTLFEKVNVGRAVILVKAVAEHAKVIRDARMPSDTRLALEFIKLKFGCFNLKLRFAAVTPGVLVSGNVFNG